MPGRYRQAVAFLAPSCGLFRETRGFGGQTPVAKGLGACVPAGRILLHPLSLRWTLENQWQESINRLQSRYWWRFERLVDSRNGPSVGCRNRP